jgi:aminodeoxyfutalosine synthase
LLDNFPHLKAYWVSLTPKVAQLCLLFGADDLDGTVVEERVYHAVGSPSPRGLSEEELRSLIREAGFEPRERDALYREVAVSGG